MFEATARMVELALTSIPVSSVSELGDIVVIETPQGYFQISREEWEEMKRPGREGQNPNG